MKTSEHVVRVYWWSAPRKDYASFNLWTVVSTTSSFPTPISRTHEHHVVTAVLFWVLPETNSFMIVWNNKKNGTCMIIDRDRGACEWFDLWNVHLNIHTQVQQYLRKFHRKSSNKKATKKTHNGYFWWIFPPFCPLMRPHIHVLLQNLPLFTTLINL